MDMHKKVSLNAQKYIVTPQKVYYSCLEQNLLLENTHGLDSGP